MKNSDLKHKTNDELLQEIAPLCPGGAQIADIDSKKRALAAQRELQKRSGKKQFRRVL